MKKLFTSLSLSLLLVTSYAQNKVTWVATSPDKQWVTQTGLIPQKSSGKVDVSIQFSKTQQTIEGFGTCFNELGWTSLNSLPAKDRENILKELFAPNHGANFTICRMPVGANDFSRNWYSYNETEGDFDMKNFSIANDFETLIPFIKNAQKYNPKLKIWASPWSPPQWMKYNKHYASRSVLGNSTFKSEKWGMDFTGINNGLPVDREGKEGTDMFIQDEKYFKAYALYFSKFIEAYKKQAIHIGMVMPQNEFNSPQVFPSCTWTAAGLTRFVSYLGPEMQKSGVKLFFGTVERANEKLVDTLLTDPKSKDYIKGVGFQWAGKGAIEGIHKRYPKLPLYQSEQECGTGTNDWAYCNYAWDLMKQYLNNGTSAYMYWNTSLNKGAISTWGWKQNSLVSVDTNTHTYSYNYEFYLMKHLSHFVKTGAKKVASSGLYTDLLAFVNPDKSLVILIRNAENQDKTVSIQLKDKIIQPTLKANTINTILVN
ncbi:glycoside hydrolase family 30 beta sandwich domain-containing protein [Arcicella rosea]|uniref:Glucosylceramidase n=1 Tax=Arcicella rosea TaxID=502909 RepID=A0A841ER06_9BACT|nr:glycoside hydrolase family 30 protein [Arcicella rosea]MBB6003453.1 glucosylceramidase [Arcicella rosea]